MILHTDLGETAFARKRMLKSLIENKEIVLGGNLRLKIYGTLSCNSGKRMKTENRVFFSSEEEAIRNNYRPCGHCLKDKYQKWKDEPL
jgi:Metal binding domain of Ada